VNETWHVTIFIDEDDAAASARARLTGGNGLGHLVGHGFCRTTPTAPQGAAQRAAVHALEDLSHQLDYVVLTQHGDAVTETAAPQAPGRPRQQRAGARGMLSVG